VKNLILILNLEERLGRKLVTIFLPEYSKYKQLLRGEICPPISWMKADWTYISMQGRIFMYRGVRYFPVQ
jgi:hypothetical protein